jgi:hypothetical protein
MSAPINPETGRPYFATFAIWFIEMHRAEMAAIRAAENATGMHDLTMFALERSKIWRNSCWNLADPAWQDMYHDMLNYIADVAWDAYDDGALAQNK